MEFTPVYWFILIGAVAAFAIAKRMMQGWPDESRRRQDAAELGFRFLEAQTPDSPEPEFIPRLYSEAVHLPGTHFSFHNHMRREGSGRVLHVFDLAEELRSRRSSSLESLQTAALFKDGRARFPVFMLAPGILRHAKRVDLDLPFLKRYTLLADDSAAAADLFLGRPSGFLEGEDGWTLEGAGSYALLFRDRKTEPALRPFVQAAERIFEGLL
ncbi:MAG: hypothetical protein WC728_09190 [Elusimicrobiota bacterium]